MNFEKERLYKDRCALLVQFCSVNFIQEPAVVRLGKGDRLYHLATCAFYRQPTIKIMVEKCAAVGCGGRQWSCPGYAVDRTPYGVLQHELGHHVDTLYSADHRTGGFSSFVYASSGEPPLTGYLGKDNSDRTFYMEWFAENFRLFVTNPNLSLLLRPKFFKALKNAGLKPVVEGCWEEVLMSYGAPERTIQMAAKKIAAVQERLL